MTIFKRVLLISIFTVVPVITAIGGVFAEDADINAMITLLNAKYDKIGNYEAGFDSFVTFNGVERRVEGKFIKKKPDKYKLWTRDKSSNAEEVMVSDGKQKITYYPGRKKAYLFAATGPDPVVLSVDSLRRADSMVFKGEEQIGQVNVYIFEFNFDFGEELGKSGRIRISIGKDDGIIRQFNEFGNDGMEISGLRVTDIKLNIDIDDSVFGKDVIPEGTELISR